VTRRVMPQALLAHPVVSLIIVGLLAGGGLRFVPASVAARGSEAGGTASTACAAQ